MSNQLSAFILTCLARRRGLAYVRTQGQAIVVKRHDIDSDMVDEAVRTLHEEINKGREGNPIDVILVPEPGAD